MNEPTDEHEACEVLATDEREVWEVLNRIVGELDPNDIREHTYPCQDCDGGCEVCDT